MKNIFVIFLAFCSFHFIYGFSTYPLEIYTALNIISRQRTLDKNYFESCVFVGSALAGNISFFHVSDEFADIELITIATRLNENLLKARNIEKFGDGEKFMLGTINNMLGNYSLLLTTPTRTYQNNMRLACSRSSNEVQSLIEKFNISINMISRSFMSRNNFTDSSFQDFDEFSRSVASQVAFCYPICETFTGSSSESTVKNLEEMMIMLNEMLLRIDEERRGQFWNPDFLSYVTHKIIDETTTSNQLLADKIQSFFENEFSRTDYSFSALVFNGGHPFIASNNVYILHYSDNKNVILIRTNEKHHCNEYDNEPNIKTACVDGSGSKTENIRNYLTEKCSNSTVVVMDDSITNYVFSTTKMKPNVKISNMSKTWLFWEKCLSKIFIAIINN